ncbi:hypothetical protein GGD66_002336 [Bradyrhizobium sp. CIR48]|nr:hypothetical protein [Bradyrhizobium sp. CIR48]MBB4423792.1 hypothetical protein [Bradyrhizobium sp. CIR48]
MNEMPAQRSRHLWIDDRTHQTIAPAKQLKNDRKTLKGAKEIDRRKTI